MKTLLGTSAILVSALLIPFSVSAATSAELKKAQQIACRESGLNDSQDEGDSDESANGNASDSVSLAEIVIQKDASGKAISLQIDRDASNGLPAIHLKFTAENDSLNHTVEQQESDVRSITDVEAILARNSSGDVIHLHVNDHTYSGWAGSTLEMAIGGKTFSTNEGSHSVSCKGAVKFKVGTEEIGDLEGDDGELLP